MIYLPVIDAYHPATFDGHKVNPRHDIRFLRASLVDLQSQLSPVDGTGCSIQQPHPPLMSLSDIKDQPPSGQEMALVLTAPLQKKTRSSRMQIGVEMWTAVYLVVSSVKVISDSGDTAELLGNKTKLSTNYSASHLYANRIFNYANR